MKLFQQICGMYLIGNPLGTYSTRNWRSYLTTNRYNCIILCWLSQFEISWSKRCTISSFGIDLSRIKTSSRKDEWHTTSGTSAYTVTIYRRSSKAVEERIVFLKIGFFYWGSFDNSFFCPTSTDYKMVIMT